MAVKLTSSPLKGRTWILSELQEWLDGGGGRATLVGPPGIGKSRVGHAFAEANPGSVVVNFSSLHDPYETINNLRSGSAKGARPPLLILDAIEAAPPGIWRGHGLEAELSGIPTLYIFRPGVHYEGLQRPGTRLFALDPSDPKHEADLLELLSEVGLESLAGKLSTFQEAQFLLANPDQGATQLESYYLALWRETTRAHNGATRVLVEQVALLLADTPEGLPFEAISDFTGIPLVSIREAVDLLAPILTMVPSGVTLFSRGLANYLTRSFSRDLGPVHGRIVSYFRETYPSWHEMHDPYGWRYLVLHCDRLARASRRQDFSVLHWLNEGSFSQLKLERTGMLPSVLKDLRLSLLASLETEDIPRTISFGCRIARLRKHDSVKIVHRLADAGNLAMARENAFLVSGEGQKFLIWLLFASQTLEGRDLSSTAALLQEALHFPPNSLNETEIRLGANLLATMLSYPDLPAEIQSLLLDLMAMGNEPLTGCLAFKTAAHNHLLTDPQRLSLLERARVFAALLTDKPLRTANEREIAARMARLSDAPEEPGVAFPERLVKAAQRDKELTKMLAEVRKGSTLVATVAAALVPITDETWANEAFLQLIEIIDVHRDEEALRHGLSGLIQSLEDSAIKDIEPRLLDALSTAILSFGAPLDRSRFLARFAVMLTIKERPLEAQQRVSLSAANAFSVTDTALRANALLHLAGMVAATGALGRARDLSFHAIELSSKVEELDRESRQLIRLLSTSTAKNDSAEEIVRLGDSLRFDNSPVELEAKGRALVALAAGLARLGADHQAQTYRERAIETSRAIENVDLRVHLLCDLAGALHQSGEKRQARKLAKEARALYEEAENDRGLLAAAGLLRLSMVLENRTQIKKGFDACLKFLKDTDLHRWLDSPALIELLGLSRHLGKASEVLVHLQKARDSNQLSDQETLGLLRCELELGEFARAEALLARLSGLASRCQGGIDLALALLAFDPDRSLRHLAAVPLESSRCEGIRRMAMLNSAEIRPTQQFRVRHVLNRLTLMAIDHPDAMDSVLSRWIQGCSDHDTILAIADKMAWSTGAGGLFREAMQSVQNSAEPEFVFEEENQEDEHTAADPKVKKIDLLEMQPKETPTTDDGFQVVSLTKGRKSSGKTVGVGDSPATP